MTDRFDIEQVIRILGLEIRADQADEGRDFDVACRIALEKLRKCKEYEDLEEQDLLKVFPCKVGDTLYSALGEKVLKSEVISVKYHCEAENHGVFIRERIIIDTNDIVTEINFSDIGKTVFLTQKEAEQKLKELSK